MPGLIMAAQESWKNTGMLAGVADCGGVGNGAAEEDLCWDLNPGEAAMRGLFGTTWLEQKRTTDFYFLF